MPKSKDAYTLLTTIERERLVNRVADSNLSDEEKEKHQNSIYHNDMIVRNKIKAWLKQSDDVIFALRHMSSRKIKKEIDDEDVYHLFDLGIILLDLLDFAPFLKIGDKYVIGKSSTPGAGPLDMWIRPANEIDFGRNIRIHLLTKKLGSYTSNMESFHQAVELFKEVKTKKDGRSENILNLFHEQINENIKNVEQCYHDLTLNPSDKNAYNKLGKTFIEMGEYDRACKWFDKAIELDPNFDSAKMNKIEAISKMGRPFESRIEFINFFDEHVKLWEETIKTDDSPENRAKYWFTVAFEEFFVNKNYKKSLKHIDKVLAIMPNVSDAWELKGDILKAMKRNNEAEAAFTKAKEPSNSRKLSDEL